MSYGSCGAVGVSHPDDVESSLSSQLSPATENVAGLSLSNLQMPKRECCPSCKGDYYHYAGCAIGEHGEVYHTCEEWVHVAVNAVKQALRSHQIGYLTSWRQALMRSFIETFEK